MFNQSQQRKNSVSPEPSRTSPAHRHCFGYEIELFNIPCRNTSSPAAENAECVSSSRCRELFISEAARPQRAAVLNIKFRLGGEKTLWFSVLYGYQGTIIYRSRRS